MAEAKLPDLLKQLSEAVIGRTGLEIILILIRVCIWKAMKISLCIESRRKH